MRTWSEARGAAASTVPRTLLVCATPRSGSGVLCEALTATGLAGRIDEYLHPPVAAEYADAWGVAPGPAWVERLLVEARTPNGVLGLKAMWPDLERALAGSGPGPAPADGARRIATVEAARGAGEAAAGAVGFLAGWPGDLVCVHLARRDRVRQAISMWRAAATGQFRRRDGDAVPPARPLPEFWPGAIENRMREIEDGERGWEAWFAAAGLQPLRLVYEDDLAEGAGPGVTRVLAALGEEPASAAAAPTFRRQTDDWTERMIAAFEASRGAP